MKRRNNPLLKETNAIRLLALLNEADGEPRFVGGCVRDALLKRPFTDIDIATTLTPEAVIEQLTKADIKAIPTGLKHGTVTAVIDQSPYEITTLREDVRCDGRHAEVRFTTSWEKDASRRDFTMNALSMDQEGEIHDYFGGIEDAQAGIVRFVGEPEQRIQEDYLRMLRLFRFYAYYGKSELDEAALEACKAHKSHLGKLSAERIQHELLRLFAAPKLSPALEAMNNCGLLTEILDQSITSFDLHALHALEAIEQKSGQSPHALVRLGTLLQSHGWSDMRVRVLAKHLKLSNQDQFRLVSLSVPLFHCNHLTSVKEQKKALRVMGQELYIQTALIAWALARGKTGDNSSADQAYQDILALAKRWSPPAFPLSGKDLLEKGLKPGKHIGSLLEEAESYWEDHDYACSKAELLTFIEKKAG